MRVGTFGIGSAHRQGRTRSGASTGPTRLHDRRNAGWPRADTRSAGAARRIRCRSGPGMRHETIPCQRHRHHVCAYPAAERVAPALPLRHGEARLCSTISPTYAWGWSPAGRLSSRSPSRERLNPVICLSGDRGGTGFMVPNGHAWLDRHHRVGGWNLSCTVRVEPPRAALGAVHAAYPATLPEHVTASR